MKIYFSSLNTYIFYGILNIRIANVHLWKDTYMFRNLTQTSERYSILQRMGEKIPTL